MKEKQIPVNVEWLEELLKKGKQVQADFTEVDRNNISLKAWSELHILFGYINSIEFMLKINQGE